MQTTRKLYEIAEEISSDWEKPYFGAVPYLQALHSLETPADYYGMETADMVIAYFLANAQTWRGEVARRVKKELKAMLKEFNERTF